MLESLRVAFPAACGSHRSRQRDRRLAHHGPEIGSPLQYPAPWGGDPLFQANKYYYAVMASSPSDRAPPRPRQPENELSLAELLQVVGRRRWLLLGCVFLG